MKTLEKINQEWKSFLKKERIRFLVKNKLAYVEHLEQMNVIDVNWRKSEYSFEKNLHIIAFQYKQYEFHYRKHDIGGEFSYGNNTLTECLSEDCITLFIDVIKQFPFDTYISSLKEEKRAKIKELLRSN